jgi:hypothetical protein
LQGSHGDRVEFKGQAVSFEVAGEPRFVERLPDDMRPTDAG